MKIFSPGRIEVSLSLENKSEEFGIPQIVASV